MRKVVKILFSFLLLTFLGSIFVTNSFAQVTPLFTYSGILRNGAGTPAPGVILYLQNGSDTSQTTTAADGSFALHVPAGSYNLILTSNSGNIVPSMTNATTTGITVNADTVQDLTVPTQTLTVTVLDPLGQPLANADVSVQGTFVPFSLFSGAATISTSGVAGVRTDASGVAQVPMLPTTGNDLLEVDPPAGSGLPSKTQTITFQSAESITVSYPPLFTYSGILRNGSGTPAPGVIVYLQNGSNTSQTTTGSDGSFALHVFAGSYNLILTSNSGNIVPSMTNATTPNITITGDTVQDLTVPTQTLTVIVLDPLGQPLANADVSIQGTFVPFSLFSGAASISTSGVAGIRTDANGIAQIPFLPTTSDDLLEVDPPAGSGLPSKTETITFQSAESITVSYAPIFTYSGVLRNGAGAPVPNVTLYLQNGSDTSQTTTAADGSFALHVPAGTYNLILTNGGGNSAPSMTNATTTGITVNGDTVQDLTIPTQVLEVTVLDPSGQPLPNADVSVQGTFVPFSLFSGAASISTSGVAGARTDASGAAQVPMLPTTGDDLLEVDPPAGSGLPSKTRTITFNGPSSITITYQAPIVSVITPSTNPMQINTAGIFTASFTEGVNTAPHTAIWNWGDGTPTNPDITPGTVTETNGSGSVSNSHTYTATGVYTVTLTITDNYGVTGTSTYQFVTVYDPNTSFAGGRSFDNPSIASPNNSGKVSFGVSSKYNNSGQLTGSFKMNFKAAVLDFASTFLQSLTTSNGKAYLKGSGTLNGSSGYTFLVTGIDGSVVGGSDLVRIQIKNGSTIIYDSQPGGSDTVDPTTSVATGNIRIH